MSLHRLTDARLCHRRNGYEVVVLFVDFIRLAQSLSTLRCKDTDLFAGVQINYLRFTHLPLPSSLHTGSTSRSTTRCIRWYSLCTAVRGADTMGTTDSVGIDFAQPPMENLTISDEFSTGLCDDLDGRVWVDTVLVEDTECLHLEVAERVLAHTPDMITPIHGMSTPITENAKGSCRCSTFCRTFVADMGRSNCCMVGIWRIAVRGGSSV